MKCLDFKRLALSDPNSSDGAYLTHKNECAECRAYRRSVQKMDADLAQSLNIEVPSDLVARLQLNQELLVASDKISRRSVTRQFAIAASFAASLFVAGFMVSNQLSFNNEISQDHKNLLASVVEHMNEQPVTPVWSESKANRTVGTLLASYDPELKFKNMENLHFGRICTLGKYRGLHASLETQNGQITFAYIKGEMIGDILDASYAGYMTRVKPVRGGTLIIFSQSHTALDQADKDIESAMYWDV